MSASRCRSSGTKPTYAGIVTRPLVAVDLPYGNGNFSMTILVPTGTRTADQLVESLDARRWQQVVDSLRPGDMQLYVPKFTLRYEDEW